MGEVQGVTVYKIPYDVDKFFYANRCMGTDAHEDDNGNSVYVARSDDGEIYVCSENVQSDWHIYLDQPGNKDAKLFGRILDCGLKTVSGFDEYVEKVASTNPNNMDIANPHFIHGYSVYIYGWNLSVNSDEINLSRGGVSYSSGIGMSKRVRRVWNDCSFDMELGEICISKEATKFYNNNHDDKPFTILEKGINIFSGKDKKLIQIAHNEFKRSVRRGEKSLRLRNVCKDAVAEKFR